MFDHYPVVCTSCLSEHCLAVVLAQPDPPWTQVKWHLTRCHPLFLLVVMESLSTWMTVVLCCLALGSVDEHWSVLCIPTYLETGVYFVRI